MDLEAAPLQVTQVGQLEDAGFCSDGRIYTAKAAPRAGGGGRSLGSLAPLAVRVHVKSSAGVSNSERNRARVERKLAGGGLTVMLDRTGAATFFKAGELVVFRKSAAAAVSSPSSSPQDTEEEEEETTSPEESNTEEVPRVETTLAEVETND